MTNESLRFGLIGCGAMGRVHASNAQHVPGLELVAFADVVSELADSFLAQYGGEYSTSDAEKILSDDSIDGVFIVTGPSHHARLVSAAAQAGKHIFVEKPLALDVKHAREIEKAVLDSGIKFQLGFCLRFGPIVRRAKELIGSPDISMCQCAGTIAEQACHNIDLLLNVFHDAELVSIQAIGGRFNPEPPTFRTPHTTYEIDSFTANLSFSDGSVSTYIQHGVGWNPVLKKYHMQFFKEDMCVYLADRFTKAYYCPGQAVEHVMSLDFEPDKSFLERFGYMGHYNEIEELVKAILNDTQPSITVTQGRAVQEVEQAIVEAAQSGETIDFREWQQKH